jgi:hypothetical protein
MLHMEQEGRRRTQEMEDHGALQSRTVRTNGVPQGHCTRALPEKEGEKHQNGGRRGKVKTRGGWAMSVASEK